MRIIRIIRKMLHLSWKQEIIRIRRDILKKFSTMKINRQVIGVVGLLKRWEQLESEDEEDSEDPDEEDKEEIRKKVKKN